MRCLGHARLAISLSGNLSIVQKVLCLQDSIASAMRDNIFLRFVLFACVLLESRHHPHVKTLSSFCSSIFSRQVPLTYLCVSPGLDGNVHCLLVIIDCSAYAFSQSFPSQLFQNVFNRNGIAVGCSHSSPERMALTAYGPRN